MSFILENNGFTIAVKITYTKPGFILTFTLIIGVITAK